jgi:hypothetical protein
MLFRRDFALAEPPPLPGDIVAEAPAPPEDASASGSAEAIPFRRLHVPFGPFLALSAIEWLLFSRELSGLLGSGR